MSAPGNYGDLKVSIRDFLGIDSTSDYAAFADTFIDLAESRFNATLRTRNQVSTSALTLDANGEASLPADYVGFKRATAAEGSTVSLVECSAEQMANLYPRNEAGIARHIAIDGDKVRVRTITSSTVTLVYYAAVTPLDDTNTTNWLLTKMPGLYLAASLYEGAMTLGDDEGAQRYGGMMEDQLELLQRSDRSERIGNRALRARGATP